MPDFEALRRLLPRELPGGELSLTDDDPPIHVDEVGSSRIGGDPDLPVGVPWPEVDGEPLVFVAQLDLAEIAKHVAAAE
ncbi:MAG TPA: DUF1963 domain-containing protein, partial [Enhygromyxa sp.]|nr:DUF1963 domain-containing protein [Enhygromyxa sp.]